jgi:hypothetical protein
LSAEDRWLPKRYLYDAEQGWRLGKYFVAPVGQLTFSVEPPQHSVFYRSAGLSSDGG